MYQLLPTINKQWILERVTQEQIFEYYLGITVQVRKLIRSPLRKDDNPTCSFRYYNNTLIFKDFSGHFAGNCFKLVMFIHNISYFDALEKIAGDFNLIEFTKKYDIILPKSPKKMKKEHSIIQIKKRPLANSDIEYWNQFNINEEILNRFKVFPIKHCWINENITYTYCKSNPAYAYYFGNGEFKIYFPLNKQLRFISNTQRVQGYTQLPDSGKLVILTKSLKDVMTLCSFGINSIALQNEVVMPTKMLVDKLNKRFETIYSFYDFDLAGIKTANKIRKKFNIQPLFLTNGRFGSINYKAKDISDYCKFNGVNKTKELIKS